MKLSRRKLLKLGCIGAAVSGTAGAVVWLERDLIRKLQPGELVDHLKTNFDYLTFNFNDAQFTEFVNAYRDGYHDIWRGSWYVVRGGEAEDHAKFMEHFTMTFLMSTDFFLYGADESRSINYVMFYHPYHSPCWNPIGMSA